MLNLQLNEKERSVLTDIIKARLLEMHTEISHTDMRDFRQHLKEDEQILKHLQEKLSQAA
jgi:hypothetical protein